MGFGWSASYFMNVHEASGVATITQENGAIVEFRSFAGGWVAAPRVDATLTRDASGTWTFTRMGRELFEFSAAGRLTAVRDLSGNTVSLGYASDELSTITDPAGRVLTLTWVAGRVVKVTAPPAVLAAGGSPVVLETTYGYDPAGDLTSVTDAAGGITTFGYDASHRVTSVREARHHALGAGAPVVHNHYDAVGRVDWQDDRLGRRTTFAYAPGATTVTDPVGNAVVYTHNAEGICTGIIRDPGPNQSQWVFEVDPRTLGRTRVTDPNGQVASASYDGFGRRTSIMSSVGTTFTTYTAQGLPATVKDALGVTTTYSYQPGTDRLMSLSRPVSPGTGTATTSFAYGDPVNPGLVTSVVDVRGKTSALTYSSAGDLVSSTDPTGGQTTWTYNAIGWPLTTVAPAGNATGGVPSHQSTSYRYNARGQVLAITGPTGAVIENDRDASGVLTAQRDPVGRAPNRPASRSTPPARSLR